MGKHVVYVRAREEKELEADGLDPGEWVRDLVKDALKQRRIDRADVKAPDNEKEAK